MRLSCLAIYLSPQLALTIKLSRGFMLSLRITRPVRITNLIAMPEPNTEQQKRSGEVRPETSKQCKPHHSAPGAFDFCVTFP